MTSRRQNLEQDGPNMIRITEYLSVGINERNKIFTYVNGYRLVQCRRAIIAAPMNSEIDNMDDFIRYYIDAEATRDADISIEQELFAHASNIQAWVESGYDLRLIHTQLGIPILARLITCDLRAIHSFLLIVKERWQEGNDVSRLALIKKGDPYYGFIVLLVREGDIPRDQVLPHIPYIDYLLEVYNSNDMSTFFNLWNHRKRWVSIYIDQHIDEILEEFKRKWMISTFREKNQLISKGLKYAPAVCLDKTWEALVYLTINDEDFTVENAKPFISYISYLVNSYTELSALEFFKSVNRVSEDNNHRNRVWLHEELIYTDHFERSLAHEIRVRGNSRRVSPKTDYPSYCWSMQSKYKWIPIKRDRRTRLYKSTRELVEQYSLEPTHVLRLETFVFSNWERCIIRFEDGSFVEGQVRI